MKNAGSVSYVAMWLMIITVFKSAGVGRTGTLMAGRFLLERLRSNRETIDIFGTVLALRKWRQRLVQSSVRICAMYT